MCIVNAYRYFSNSTLVFVSSTSRSPQLMGTGAWAIDFPMMASYLSKRSGTSILDTPWANVQHPTPSISLGDCSYANKCSHFNLTWWSLWTTSTPRTTFCCAHLRAAKISQAHPKGQTRFKHEWLQLQPQNHHYIGNSKKHNARVVRPQPPYSRKPSKNRKVSLRDDSITCYAPLIANVIITAKGAQHVLWNLHIPFSFFYQFYSQCFLSIHSHWLAIYPIGHPSQLGP